MNACRAAALIALAGVLCAPAADAQTLAASCGGLTTQSLASTTITAAEAVTAGSFTPPGTTNTIANLPPFCRVAGVIAPTAESHILFEVWMPLEKWNGKFAGVGNGGWAGTISFGALGDQLRRGYATASTNTGHEAAPGVEHGPVRAREARTADRLRLPLAPRDRGQGQERSCRRSTAGRPSGRISSAAPRAATRA